MTSVDFYEVHKKQLALAYRRMLTFGAGRAVGVFFPSLVAFALTFEIATFLSLSISENSSPGSQRTLVLSCAIVDGSFESPDFLDRAVDETLTGP